MALNSKYTRPDTSTQYSGLSGNEMYCAYLLGFKPGNLLVGNSVFSMGYLGSLRSSVRSVVGGELVTFTHMVAEGRRLSLERFEHELQQSGGSGAVSVNSEIIFHPGNVEFLTVGSSLHTSNNEIINAFASASDAQELFCQWDAGYQPIDFVFGNVAYSIGIGRNITGSFRKLVKGEVSQYSEIFNTTRSLALERIIDDAKTKGANSVVGIRTSILPLLDMSFQEMVMTGTASHNPVIDALAQSVGGVTTSDLTAVETWNIAKLGYAPIKLVLGTSVYSLGIAGGVKAAIRNLVKGEINELTELIYGAREESLKKVKVQAEESGADDVLGIKTYVYDLGGGMIEFLAIGTAVKIVEGVNTNSNQLPPQAIIQDNDTFKDLANKPYGINLQTNNFRA